MIGLPKGTEFNKRIPKQKFYEKLSINSALKRSFIDQVKVIYWRNKIATSTINLTAGKKVTEIELFEVSLTEKNLDKDVLLQMDKEIPYHIVFLLEYEGLYQAWISYKEETTSQNNAFNVNTYYHTDWLKESALPLKIDGFDLDQVYENFVRQIAGESLKFGDQKESLKKSVERDLRRKQLKKQIDVLQAKVYAEKQLNKQFKLNDELKQLKLELENL